MKYILSDEAWSEFMAMLDRPAVYQPRLAELLNEPDLFVD